MSFTRNLISASALLKAPIQKRAFASAVETAPKVFPTTVQAFLRDFKTNEPVSFIDLDRSVFNAPIRRDILHRVVVWQRDAMRQGTHSSKTRSEVAGTSKKQAPQKGRGKARVGDGKAPHMKGGGIAFGPKPRDHSTELPRKVQELGLRVALSAKYAQDQLTVVESLQNLTSHKTRDLNSILESSYGSPKTLIVIDDCNFNLELAARNIPNCEVIHVEETNVLDLLTYDKLIIEKSAVEALEQVLKTE
ncbi:ribosomal protein L4/L1 family-domain-containing protein [Gilbertella persicaria]|uniref:ribosomal protein L4/L1 family-domain-containing protein n=1 Tax=Gilbertella persicaria TaxID=101096 RepID=UPI00221F3D8E|nr:ribosomal protein L4/L1 family-domain-containing protein [Gilbertella persicaria]KAI8047821.1 ribosomal protein L4/L1 family-domain-containing protein [Gilbertella persicaria]